MICNIIIHCLHIIILTTAMKIRAGGVLVKLVKFQKKVDNETLTCYNIPVVI